MSGKGPEAFRTISEAAAEVGVEPHVLRFWETRFSFIKPMKRAGGRRFYRPAEVAALKRLRRLLHEDGRSIREVQAMPANLWARTAPTLPARLAEPAALRRALDRAIAAKAALDRLISPSLF